jgi:hypothetical protein
MYSSAHSLKLRFDRLMTSQNHQSRGREWDRLSSYKLSAEGIEVQKQFGDQDNAGSPPFALFHYLGVFESHSKRGSQLHGRDRQRHS